MEDFVDAQIIPGYNSMYFVDNWLNMIPPWRQNGSFTSTVRTVKPRHGDTSLKGTPLHPKRSKSPHWNGHMNKIDVGKHYIRIYMNICSVWSWFINFGNKRLIRKKLPFTWWRHILVDNMFNILLYYLLTYTERSSTWTIVTLTAKLGILSLSSIL